MRSLNSITSSTATSTAGRRAQPVRQTRSNPPRSSAKANGPFASSRLSGEAADHARNTASPHGFYPAITHFTDSINALPKEVVRHFSLLKEVDAKSYDPENSLNRLADLALNTPPLNRRDSTLQLDLVAAQPTAATQPAANGTLSEGGLGVVNAETENPTYSSQQTQPPEDSADLARRQLFLSLRYVLTEMLLILDEKNHVISTASEELQKQLARAETSFPYIDNEISEEARYGSLTHWAYKEKGNGKSNPVTNERPRRDITASNALVAAAAALSEESAAAASRSEIRREAMLARKTKTQAVDTGPNNGQQSRKRDVTSMQPIVAAASTNNKGNGNARSRKTGEAPSASYVANGPSAPDQPPSKRRKTEKSTQNRSLAEGSMAGTPTLDVADAHQTNSRGGAGSPSITPAAEPGGRKRNRGGTATGGSSKKRGNNNNNNTSALPSPALASSPVHVSSIAPRDIPATSPVPVALPPAQRPTTARGRQNSAQSLAQDPVPNGRMRPSSSASNRVKNSNGTLGYNVDAESPILPVKRTPSEPKTTIKASASNSLNESTAEHKNGGRGNGDSKNGGSSLGTLHAKDSVERPLRREATTDGSTPIMTRGGSKSSKTSTPVSSTFPELQRSRSQRGGGGVAGGVGETITTTKRSHKKGAGGIVSAQQQPQPAPPGTSIPSTGPAPTEDPHQSPLPHQTIVKHEKQAPTRTNNNDDEEEEDNDNSTEPRYCYCNQVSYGSMVACDAKDCSREWFHLSCVGLTKAPGKNEVWYCDECNDNISKKGVGGGGGIVASDVTGGGNVVSSAGMSS